MRIRFLSKTLLKLGFIVTYKETVNYPCLVSYFRRSNLVQIYKKSKTLVITV